jgi:tRNA(Arg) A34 adenosine deaminase TadA
LCPRPPIFPCFIYNNGIESDSYYLELALSQAKEGLAAGEVPVVAVLVDEEGEVLARAFNRPMPLSGPTASTEIFAQIIVARVQRTRNILNY